MFDFLKSLFLPKPSFTNIIAAKVAAIEKHPNADRLRLIKLDAGGKIIDPVVCGAFNFDVGDVVALALPGATIAKNIHDDAHKPFVLQKAKIRGIESQGMICAAFELGFGPLSEKPEIMLLKNTIKPGSQFSSDMIE
jgi:phenylalanyl-tRNA synthetase beta chain